MTISPLEIRTARITDIDEIMKIERESISSWSYNQFEDELNKAFSIFIVAEMGEIIAGYAVAWKVAGELQLNSIAVRQKYRRRNIGNMLLDALLSHCLPDKTESIYLEVRSRNSEAISFYKKNGFQINGIRKKYYSDDDAILMEKKII